MFVSRGACLLKNIVKTVATRQTLRTAVPARQSSHGGFYYRDVPAGPIQDVIVAELLGGFMWWWILWHMWHDFGHVIGEYEYPDPSKWTDEELGIPPDED